MDILEVEKNLDLLIELLESGNYPRLKEELAEENPANIAEFLEKLPAEKRLFTFRLLTKDMAADVFSYMDSDMQGDIISAISDNEIRNIVDEMFLDDTVDFLSEIPANLVKKVLKNTNESKRKLINQFLNYPENSAGSIMTIEFVEFRGEMTVKQAMTQLKATGLNKETIYSCYVVNEKRVLIGIIPLRTLILAEEDELIKDLMEQNIISVNTLDDQEDVANIFKKYNFIALPVVDNEGRLVGIITVDDAMDVIDEENTEDIEKMAALLPSDEEYLKTGVLKLAKNRIIWLMVLMISGTISSAIITKYETIIASVVALASFMPILMDTGGNAGAQASTLIIRGLAQHEIELEDVLKVLWREFRVGLISGLALGAANLARILIITPWVGIRIALVVSICLALVVVFAKCLGCTLPMLAKKLGLDPAIMASPMITTVVDAVALLIYFRLSSVFILNL